MTHSDHDQLRAIDRQLILDVLARDELAMRLAGQESLSTVSRENHELDELMGEICQSRVGEIDPAAIRSLTAVLRHIASHSRSRVSTNRVSFLGPIYSYSHLATVKYFGESASLAPVASIPAVFDAVHRGDAKWGLVPIENSTDGRVVDTLGMFVRRHMQICGEVLLPIHHNLLASGSREEIQEIQSKPQALSQCREWLSSQFPTARIVEVSSTTAAAEAAAADRAVAAIASLPAGRAYGLEVLHRDIEDRQDNVTRFAVLGREETRPTGNDKTSLLFQTEHQPGALADAMTVFRRFKLNLTWIESFPSPGSRNEYLFFVELAGHRATTDVADAIKALAEHTRRLEVLGSYPVANL